MTDPDTQSRALPAALRMTLAAVPFSLTQLEIAKLAALLDAERQAKVWTVGELAARSGVPLMAVAAALDSRRVTFDTALQLADALDCRPGALQILAGTADQIDLVDELGDEWRITRRSGDTI